MDSKWITRSSLKKVFALQESIIYACYLCKSEQDRKHIYKEPVVQKGQKIVQIKDHVQLHDDENIYYNWEYPFC